MYDVRIDGKNRKATKCVRAVTDAAFKVALLISAVSGFATSGLSVLDTPLLTFRDPLKSPQGTLAKDEEALRNTALKQHFFNHLAETGSSHNSLLSKTSICPITSLPRARGDLHGRP